MKAASAIGRAIPGADAGAVRGAAAARSTRACGRAWTRCRRRERRLVTSHDALGYYARRYGIDVVGTVIPALLDRRRSRRRARSTQLVADDPRDRREDDLRRELREPEGRGRRSPREAGAKVGKELWADSLGPEGSDGATYIGSIEANTRALVEGFTGDARRTAVVDA